MNPLIVPLTSMGSRVNLLNQLQVLHGFLSTTVSCATSIKLTCASSCSYRAFQIYCDSINSWAILDILQMSMYFAPAFFGHLLGKCLKRKYPVVEIMKLGFVVLGTFALVWWPYLHSYEAAMQVNDACAIWLFCCSSKPVYTEEILFLSKM